MRLMARIAAPSAARVPMGAPSAADTRVTRIDHNETPRIDRLRNTLRNGSVRRDLRLPRIRGCDVDNFAAGSNRARAYRAERRVGSTRLCKLSVALDHARAATWKTRHERGAQCGLAHSGGTDGHEQRCRARLEEDRRAAPLRGAWEVVESRGSGDNER